MWRSGFQTRPWGGVGCSGPGRFETCPYIVRSNAAAIIHQRNDAVNVVWHNHERIAFNTRVMIWQFVPLRLNDATELICAHFTIDNLTEQTRTILCHSRNEIRPALRVIVSAQTDRTAMLFVRVILHRCRHLTAINFFCKCDFPNVGAGFKPARGAVMRGNPVRAGLKPAPTFTRITRHCFRAGDRSDGGLAHRNNL
jgi:hypothetical protein